MTKRTKSKTKGVDIFHHKGDNTGMIVAEKDVVVSGMLSDELNRCEEALAAIHNALSGLPKGSLSVRKKPYKSREYKYHYLKFREGDKVINQHVVDDKVNELQNKLALRKKYALEAKAYEKRIAYLKKLLKTKGHPSGTREDK
jgi:hypothetical protein